MMVRINLICLSFRLASKLRFSVQPNLLSINSVPSLALTGVTARAAREGTVSQDSIDFVIVEHVFSIFLCRTITIEQFIGSANRLTDDVHPQSFLRQVNRFSPPIMVLRKLFLLNSIFLEIATSCWLHVERTWACFRWYWTYKCGFSMLFHLSCAVFFQFISKPGLLSWLVQICVQFLIRSPYATECAWISKRASS